MSLDTDVKAAEASLLTKITAALAANPKKVLVVSFVVGVVLGFLVRSVL